MPIIWDVATKEQIVGAVRNVGILEWQFEKISKGELITKIKKESFEIQRNIIKNLRAIIEVDIQINNKKEGQNGKR